MAQIRPIPGTPSGGTRYEQAYAGLGEDGFVLPAPFGSSPDGLGAYARPGPLPPRASGPGAFAGSPLLRNISRIRNRSVSGLGDAATPAAAATTTAASSAVLIAVVMFDMVLSGVAGYFVGKAVAPSSSSENKYAWWGVAAGLLGGPVGLGIEAVVALNHKGSR